MSEEKRSYKTEAMKEFVESGCHENRKKATMIFVDHFSGMELRLKYLWNLGATSCGRQSSMLFRTVYSCFHFLRASEFFFATLPKDSFGSEEIDFIRHNATEP
jgi:hypothetical protein